VVTDTRVIEAVPNFSEGRRSSVLDVLELALRAPGVLMLHRTSDPDHNRSVFTIAGPPEAVLEGLFRAVEVAGQQINLFEHRGEHPRIGATDVIPLVPIQDVTLDECVTLARALGERIGHELELPVYLYEAAALRPERRNLADVRRGQFEGLLQEIQEPQRIPDFGPARVGPAGAVVVGARPFLIAFNVFLKTQDVAIARSIARTIRESSGGLPAVKALGLLVQGQAQVSMNLTDFRRTPLHVVLETIRREAVALGTEVARSELIGLIPQDALLEAAAHYLQLPDFDGSQVIETVIRREENR
jgi:glutamate formiminotransferase / 5-formyltetrahydrofolate cyclo-ligase